MTTLSFESGNGGDSNNGQLLRDIEEISKALYVPTTSQRPLISAFNVKSQLAQKTPFCYSIPKLDPHFNEDEEKVTRDKKSSVWPWKPLKALSHLRQKKFSCCFFCHVHHIADLPSSFNGLDMSVHWKRKDNLVSSLSSRVCNGVVEFEDTLMTKCSVYGARAGQGNFVKYEAKPFLLYASVAGLKGLDIGKHWIDLTRLLPLVFDELEEDKCSGKWSTSFKLGGRAKGATLHVSFGFLVMNNSVLELGDSMRLPLAFDFNQNGVDLVDCVANCGPDDASGVLRRVASVPSSLDYGSSSSSQCSDVKVLHQVWPNPMSEFSGSVDTLYRKLDEDILDASGKFDSSFGNSELLEMPSNQYCDTRNEASGNGTDVDESDGEFTVTERGIELDWKMDDQLEYEESAAGKTDISSVEVINVAEIFEDEVECSDKDVDLNQTAEVSGEALATTLLHEDSCSRETELSIEELDPDIWNLFISESVESDVLRVGRDFLVEEISEDVSSNPGRSKAVNSLSLDSVMKAVEDDFFRLMEEKDDLYNSSQSSDHGSPRERLLREFEKDALGSGSFLYDSQTQQEDAEFSCLGLAISSSDSTNEGTTELPTIHSAMTDLITSQSTTYKNTKPKMLETLETQSLMQKWGFSEEEFESNTDSCTGGFGSPVYLPPDEPAVLPPLGEGLGPVLQLNDGGFLRSMNPSLFMGSKIGGNLIIQASRPAVLPAMGSDVLEVLQCIASGGLELLAEQVHELMPLHDLSGKIIHNLACSEEMNGRHDLYVKFESWESSSASCGKGLEFTFNGNDSRFQYISIRDLVPLVMDRIESLAIEGLRVMSGMSDLTAPTSIILKADSNLLTTGNRVGEKIQSLLGLSLPLDVWLRENASLKCGVLEDDLMIALRVQLRDPLRDFESVGPPMLALIQVRREFCTDLSGERTNLEEDMDDCFIDRSFGDDCIARFVLKEVHVAGLVTGPGKEEIWASQRQQQSGPRWLLANNMSNRQQTSKSQLSASNALTLRMRKREHIQNTLWSISRASQEFGDHLNGFSMQDSCLRNPDVVFS